MSFISYVKVVLGAGVLFSGAITISKSVVEFSTSSPWKSLFLSIFLLCYIICIPILAIDYVRFE